MVKKNFGANENRELRCFEAFEAHICKILLKLKVHFEIIVLTNFARFIRTKDLPLLSSNKSLIKKLK